MVTYLVFWALSLAFGVHIRRALPLFLFLAAIFLFVGFRFETGFDWPFYKDQFERFAGSFSLKDVNYYSQYYNNEHGYIVVAGVFASIIPNYEIFQSTIFLLFLISFVSLCQALGSKNIATALSIALTYLLLTLMFSTVRQCLAIAVFNIGVVFFLRGNRLGCVAMLALSVSFQVSSIIYIAAFIYAVIKPMRRPNIADISVIAVAVSALIVFVNLASGYLPTQIANRIEFYKMGEAGSGIGLWQIYFTLMFTGIGLYTILTKSKYNEVEVEENITRRMIVGLSILSIASFSLFTIRDRSSYELFILFSIYISRDGLAMSGLAKVGAIIFGLFFSIVNVLGPSSRIVFAPYQNYIAYQVTGEQSDGRMRQEIFFLDYKNTF